MRPKPDQRQGGAAHVTDGPDRGLPNRDGAVSLAPLRPHLGHPTDGSNDEEHGHVGRLLRGEGGEMAHDHAGGRRRVQVHVVHAHGRGDHALQVGEPVERREPVRAVGPDDPVESRQALNGLGIGRGRVDDRERRPGGVEQVGEVQHGGIAQPIGQRDAKRRVRHWRTVLSGAAGHGGTLPHEAIGLRAVLLPARRGRGKGPHPYREPLQIPSPWMCPVRTDGRGSEPAPYRDTGVRVTTAGRTAFQTS